MRATAVTVTAQTMRVRVSTRRIPQTPIQRLVSGPAAAWPTLAAARTRPAAAYEPVTRSTWSRDASDSIPNGNRATSWATMIRATPDVFRRLEYALMVSSLGSVHGATVPGRIGLARHAGLGELAKLNVGGCP